MMKIFRIILLFLSLSGCAKSQIVPAKVNGISARKMFVNAEGRPATVVINYGEAAPESEFMDVYILSGQSNAQGRAAADSINNYAGLPGPQTYNGHNAWVLNERYNPMEFDTLEAGENLGDVSNFRWGVQPQLAYDLLRYKNTDLYFLQNATGGQAIYRWYEPSNQFMWDSLTNLIDRAEAYATANSKTIRYKGFIWIQGESDAEATFDSAYYVGAALDLFADVRSYTYTPNLKCVIVQLNDCQALDSLVQFQEVQQVIADADANNILIPKNAVYACQDALHFSPITYVNIAKAIYEAIKDE